MRPQISVIFPVYNQKKSYLGLALDSILNQSFDNFEIIIIDDGSTLEECLATLSDYCAKDSRIKLITNTMNLGLIKSLNKGIEASEADFIARMDSDDISFPERLKKQFNFLEKNPSYVLVGSSAVIIDEYGKKIGNKIAQVSDFSVKNTLLLTNGFTHSSWMFRKDFIEKTGKYRLGALAVEDYDLLLRLSSNYKIINLKEPLLYHRINTLGISWGNNKYQELQSIKIRFENYQKGNYPLWQIILILPSLILYFIPTRIKRYLLSIKFKRTSL